MKKNIQAEPYFFSREDWALLPLSHTFAQASIWLAEGMEKQVATFELAVRDMPKRNYLLMCGVEEILDYLQKLRFTKDDIAYLKQLNLISEEFVKYLERFRFTGTVHAMPEGTPFFPGEPIVRISAPIIEAAMVEVALMNIASSNIPFLSKIARVKSATQGKYRISTGQQRHLSFEGTIKSARAAYLVGILGTATPLIIKKLGLKAPKMTVSGQHFFIKSFPTEIGAMRAIAKYYPDNTCFMVDTYNMKEGIKKAMQVARELETKGSKLTAVTIDSGDLDYWSRYVKHEFEKAGLKLPVIYTATNLDEYKIDEMARKNTPCDVVVVSTEYNTLSDAPKLEVVYKIAEVRDGKKTMYAAKLTPGKESYPGRKQVYRLYTKDGRLKKDIIALDGEALGKPLLVKIMDKGVSTGSRPSLDEIQAYTLGQLDKLPPRLLKLNKQEKYPVLVSRHVKKLLVQVRLEHTGK